jgi:cellulose synthase/poly-beta-1,6-N-acetylglucosamine synthase-like glycosyltransferase
MVKSRQKQPFFSVIVPVYNEEKTVSACLEALAVQNFPSDRFETIVVDNNSSDGSVNVIRKFRVKIIKEKNQGLVMARAAGLKISRGKVIINLDADCLPPPNWLKTYYRCFRQDKSLVLATGPYLPSKGEKNPIDRISNLITRLSYQYLNKVIVYWGGNVAIRKNALIAVGGYNLSNPYHDELSLLSRLARHGKVMFDQKLTVVSSNRRVRGRTLKFLFKEIIVLYLFNNLYNRLTGKHLSPWETIR